MNARDLFSAVEIDPVRRDKLLSARRADRIYVIHFTPRSGSSWLTDILEKSKVLGRPGEYFNPNFVPCNAQAFQAANLGDYIEVLLRRRRSPGGLFGFEITYHQLLATFGSQEAFLGHFGGASPLWLIREDIALQAVSLYKMVRGKVSHSPATSEEAVRQADAILPYDNDELVHWTKHIWVAETGTEMLLERTAEVPLRLSYERITALGAAGVVELIARRLGVETPPSLTEASEHEKVGTGRNVEFAQELRARNRALFARIDEERAERLRRLSP